MLKIIHVLVGVAALALSFIPSLTGAIPLLLQPDALCLLLLGLLNVQFASSAQLNNGGRSRPVLLAAAVLLIAAAAIQAAILLFPIAAIAGQPATLASLTLTFIAVLLQLATTQSTDMRTTGHKPASNALKNQHKRATAPAAGREAGTVKWFNTSKGFGFISRDSGDDVFVHFRAIRGEGHRVLVEGQRVEFSIMMRDKGLQAEDVVPTQSGE
ncbi:cold-shock protein [Stutzerimonas stutzeri]|uniref:Cold-shock protein n=1 Tax=Stutzerimonas stutzeri TaxID=316 RepID=W8R951_STUST|nr:cold shock domain-containing protein [Stutzerimonas stutzeri]AHL74887.1 cold-shock protein [Stutzerimonas stutzeri]